jgi:hypothetical protein
VVAEESEVVVVDYRVSHEGAGEVAGGREDRAEEQAHDPGPQHPSPSSGAPNLMERRERDRGRRHPDERDEKAPKKELFPCGTR